MTGQLESTVATSSIHRTLRRNLIILLALTLFSVGAALFFFVRLFVTAHFDDALRAEATAVASDVRLTKSNAGSMLDFDYTGDIMPQFERSKGADYFQVWNVTTLSGTNSDPTLIVVERSKSLGQTNLPEYAQPQDQNGEFDWTQFSDLKLPDGRAGRCVWIGFKASFDENEVEEATKQSTGDEIPLKSRFFVLAVARSRADLDATIQIFLTGLAAAGIVTCLGAWLVVNRSVRTGLKPLGDLAGAVARLKPDTLPDAVDVGPLPVEIEPVRGRMNDLLKRVRQQFERERRFSSAAAHELRTPLAELCALLDVRLRWPDSQEACVRSLAEARDITDRMEETVALLLRLARTQHADSTALERESVDVSKLMHDIVNRHATTGVDKPIKVIWTESDEQVIAHTNRSALSAIITNLVSNAALHTPSGGEMTIGVSNGRLTPGRAVIQVVNGPTNLTAHDVSHFFEPFWRKDPSRARVPAAKPVNGSPHTLSNDGSDARTHLGLGLALARSMADAIDASLTARLDEQSRLLSMTLEIPIDNQSS